MCNKKQNYYNCIYMFTFPNGKRYVGKTNNFNRRLKEHKRDNKLPVDKAIEKYGIDNIKIDILEEDLTDDEILEIETFYIDKYDTLIKNNKGYNLIRESFGGSIYNYMNEEQIEEWKIKNKEGKRKLRNPNNWDGDKKIDKRIKEVGVGSGNYKHNQQSPNVVSINVATLEITFHNGYVRCKNYLENKHINTKYDKNNIRKVCKANEQDISKIKSLGKKENRYVIVHEEQFLKDKDLIINIIKQKY